MSFAKLGGPYKLFEPEVHTERPFIVGVDERLDSPETATLKYEEAVARANGVDVRGVTPPGLLPMATYAKTQTTPVHGFDPTRGFTESPYSYQAQSYSPQQSQAAQPSQTPFDTDASALTDAGVYISPGPTVLSFQPTSGGFGTKVQLRVSTSTAGGFFSVVFGSQRCEAQIEHSAQEDGELVYTLACLAPQHIVTGSHGASVPLSLLIEGPGGEEMARAGVGQFLYRDAQVHVGGVTVTGGSGSGGGVGVGVGIGVGVAVGVGGRQDGVTGKVPGLDKSPGDRSQGSSPPRSPLQLRHDAAAGASTNTYDYPGAHGAAAPQTTQQHQHHHQQQQQQQTTQSPYVTAYAQHTSTTNHHNNTNAHTGHTGSNGTAMISAYRATATFADQYHRVAPPALRTSSWSQYGTHPHPHTHSQSHSHSHSHLDASRSPGIHTTMTRPSLTAIPLPHGSAPQLIRTSTLQSGAHGGGGVNGSGYNPYTLYPNKAVLEIVGKLDSMADGWTAEEWACRRRIVLFKKTQNGSTLTATFRPVGPGEKPANNTCVSCIWWEEKRDYFVTSVDTIYLLEQLVAAPARFTVEEKNRIRRNLEGFRPLTVSKTKAESEEFFKVIMGFPHPKPRNIEKDVKVFRWKLLEPALKKIISKYSASPSSMIPTSHMLTPAPYHALPTPPLSGGNGGEAAGYAVQGHHDVASPRSLSGSSSWGPYHGSLHSVAAASRTLSPGVRTSPQASLRMSSLPSVSGYDSRALTGSAAYGNLHAQAQVGHAQTVAVTASRWDGGTSPYASAVEGYSGLAAHQHQHQHQHHQQHQAHHQVYSNGAYGDVTSRT